MFMLIAGIVLALGAYAAREEMGTSGGWLALVIWLLLLMRTAP